MAIPIPLLDQEIIDGIAEALDEKVPVPVADYGDRVPLEFKRYADLWSPDGEAAGLEVEFDPEWCISCSFNCPAEYYCPNGGDFLAEKGNRSGSLFCLRGMHAELSRRGFQREGAGVPEGDLGVLMLRDLIYPSFSGNRIKAGDPGGSLFERIDGKRGISPCRYGHAYHDCDSAEEIRAAGSDGARDSGKFT